MTPTEQEKFLNNNARFRNLPADQQEQIRQRLQVWNGLSPEQRQTLAERERVLAQMTPEQRRYVRETLMPQWQNMRPARRQVVLGKLRDLRDLSESERAAKLNDESFVGGLAPDERQMLRDLSNLRVGTPPA
jgi:adenylosuccinate lyase